MQASEPAAARYRAGDRPRETGSRIQKTDCLLSRLIFQMTSEPACRGGGGVGASAGCRNDSFSDPTPSQVTGSIKKTESRAPLPSPRAKPRSAQRLLGSCGVPGSKNTSTSRTQVCGRESAPTVGKQKSCATVLLFSPWKTLSNSWRDHLQTLSLGLKAAEKQRRPEKLRCKRRHRNYYT